MTNEKAGMIKRTIELLERDCSNMNFQCDCERKCNTDGRDCYIKFAIKVLKKQIPKKPEEETYFKNYEWEKKCPTCGDWVILNSGTRMKFCCNCGQAIDWSEAE